MSKTNRRGFLGRALAAVGAAVLLPAVKVAESAPAAPTAAPVTAAAPEPTYVVEFGPGGFGSKFDLDHQHVGETPDSMRTVWQNGVPVYGGDHQHPVDLPPYDMQTYGAPDVWQRVHSHAIATHDHAAPFSHQHTAGTLDVSHSHRSPIQEAFDRAVFEGMEVHEPIDAMVRFRNRILTGQQPNNGPRLTLAHLDELRAAGWTVVTSSGVFRG